jgi:putative FmdB family regulatory protein
MPTYEYECTKCGKVFDLFQPITEAPRKKLRSTDPKPCKCNAPVLRRISTGGGLIFKGSGFYLTDYRSESYKQAAKADSGAAEPKGSDSKGGESTKTETKTSSAGETKATSSSEKPGKKKSQSKRKAD